MDASESSDRKDRGAGVSVVRVIVRNAVSNWVGFAVQVAVAFFLTPFILDALGASRYGIWALIVSLTGYYGLLDLGFRAGLTQYLTRYLATRNFDQMNRSASTGFVALASCGALIFLSSLALAWLAPILFHVAPELEAEVWWALIINGTAVALQFPLFTFAAVFTATQRFDLANAIGIVTRLATALATFLCLHQGYGLVGLSVVVATGNLLDYALRWSLAYRILPQLKVSPRLANLRSCWEFTHFGLWNMVGAASVQLMYFSPAIVIALFLPPAALAPYALALSLISHFANLFMPLGAVFFPVAADLSARGQTKMLQTVYLVGSKILLVLAIPLGLIAASWAPDFFHLWISSRLD